MKPTAASALAGLTAELIDVTSQLLDLLRQVHTGPDEKVDELAERLDRIRLAAAELYGEADLPIVIKVDPSQISPGLRKFIDAAHERNLEDGAA